MVASYSVTGNSFTVEKPRLWSEKRIADSATRQNVDLAPDGKRIAAIISADAPEDPKSRNHVIFLENFSDELQRKVPAGK
jgi:hypothetical protein